MASAEIVSNLKLITSGNVPTTSNLGNGELAFGLVGGVAKLYGNVNGTIVDFSDFLKVAPVTSVAGKTGAVTLNKSDVGLGNVDNTADANKSVAQAAAWKGTDTRDVNSPPSFYQYPNSMKSVYEFKNTTVIEVNSLLPDMYCYVQTLTPWGDASGGLPVQLATQGYGGTARYAIRSATDASTWGAWKKIATQDEIPSVPVLSVNTKTGNVVLTLADISSVFDGVDGAKVSINVGTLPTYPGTNTGITWGTDGFGMSQGIDENSGIWFDGDGINMWSPCDRDAITYYDEDDGSKVFRVTSTGIVYRKDGKRALYEGEAGGGTPYVTTISSWSGSSGNYYKQITVATHGKGAYPSVHTYVQNGDLWEETYDSPAIDTSGNVTVYTNVAISIKVVIK